MVYGLQVSPRFPAPGAPSLCRRILLGLMCTSFCGSPQRSSCLCFLRTCTFSWSIVSCGVPCSGLRVGKLFCSSRRLWGILGCVHRRFPSLVILQCSEILLIVLRIKLDLVCPLVCRTNICGSTSRSTLIEMICCACAWWHASTQRASGLVQAGQWFCRRWYTWYDGQPGINQKTCRGSSGVWILETWASFTVAVCALLVESLHLVHGMFCKLHRCFFRSLLG